VLLALTQAGVSREDAYRLVQRNAMKVAGNMPIASKGDRSETQAATQFT
jgi:adenylosuccinate lyase